MGLPLAVKDLSRKVHENHFNYTDDQLQEKQLALKTMRELYPDVPAYYAELVYDLCKNKTQDEIDIIKQKVENEPPRHPINNILVRSDGGNADVDAEEDVTHKREPELSKKI